MYKIDLKNIIVAGVIGLFLAPVATYSVLDIQQTRQERVAQEKFLEKQAELILAEKKAYLTGKFEPEKRNDFARITPDNAVNGNVMYLAKEAYEAFQLMATAAKLDGINLRIASATRNFDYQKGIWEKKWTGETLVDFQNLAASIPDGSIRFKKILEYSAAPGTSRHHWGTDIDINFAIPAYFEEGRGKLEYEWLVENAARFGFCQPYNEKGALRPVGYNEEKWHWSYLPLAQTFTEEYAKLVKPEDITGFLGEEYIPENLIYDYVWGINPACL